MIENIKIHPVRRRMRQSKLLYTQRLPRVLIQSLFLVEQRCSYTLHTHLLQPAYPPLYTPYTAIQHTLERFIGHKPTHS